jgi:prophage maintenance system killer protein
LPKSAAACIIFLFSKAGILFFLPVKNHCFVDGSKRTAALALIEFLKRNGFTLEATDDELYTIHHRRRHLGFAQR